MTAEELYEKEFGDADNIPKESVLRLLRHFAKALELEREKALRIHDIVGRSEQLKCGNSNPPCSPNIKFGCLECTECNWSE